jgi:ribosomal protein S18 acetylase RimI-like enzyme
MNGDEASDPVDFRYAELRDERALSRLDRVTWSSSNSPVPLLSEDDDFFGKDTPDDFIVAVRGDTVVGYVKVRLNSPLTSNAHVLVIGGLAVDPSEQRRGLGTALVEKAIEEATNSGARRLKLHVLGTNSVAMHLYERCGFAVEAVLHEEFLLDDVFVDDVIMSVDLSRVSSV